MRKIKSLLLVMLLVAGTGFAGSAQCTVDNSNTTVGLTPPKVPAGTEGDAYSETFQIYVPADTTVFGFPCTVNYFKLIGTNGFPAGFGITCNPASCQFAGGSNACATISGPLPLGSAGTYPVTLVVEFSASCPSPIGPVLVIDTIYDTLVVLPVCIIDTANTAVGLTPPDIPDGTAGAFYDETFQIFVPADTIVFGMPATVNYFKLVGANGLPSGITIACNPPSCQFDGGENGCAVISGQLECGSAGNYTPELVVEFSATLAPPFGVVTVTDTIYDTVDVAPFPAPVNLSATNIGPCSATLSWDDVEGAVKYEINGGLQGSNPNNWVTLIQTSSSRDQGGLASDKCYTWRVRAWCTNNGSVKSDWSALNTFCTLPCDPPTSTSTTNIGMTTARLNWTPVPGCSGYQIVGRPVGSGALVQLDVPNSATAFKNVGGLNPCTSYEWAIKTKCKNGFSALTTLTTFTTAGCPARTGQFDNVLGTASVVLELYPNPANSQFTVGINGTQLDETFQVNVYDIAGKNILNAVFNATGDVTEVNLNTSDLSEGLYQVIVQNDRFYEVQKLMIAK